MYHVIVLFLMLKKEIEPWNFFKKYFKIMNKPINIRKQNEIEYMYRKWKQAIDPPKFLVKVFKLFLDINK